MSIVNSQIYSNTATNVRAHLQNLKVPIAPMGDSLLFRCLFAGCWCPCPVWHSDHLIVHHQWEHSRHSGYSGSKVPIAPMGK